MLLHDFMIRRLIESGNIGRGIPQAVRREVFDTDDTLDRISYGVSSGGYDIRVKGPFLIPTDTDAPLDPKMSPSEQAAQWEELTVHGTPREQWVDIPAHSLVLCGSVESFRVPDDQLWIVLSKSTYARLGLIVNCTPMEPGWIGEGLTIELINPQYRPIRVYVNEGIAQVLLFQLTGRPTITYADKGGKYQNQEAVTLARP